MSKPASAALSTSSLPVGARVPAFAGDWTAVCSRLVSRSNRLVAVPVPLGLVPERAVHVQAAARLVVAGGSRRGDDGSAALVAALGLLDLALRGRVVLVGLVPGRALDGR
jgi:hypothetical protein